MKAPFPYFGGKSRAAHLIWPRFGDVQNYVEPFAGSLAVLLNRPHAPRTETVNDLDCYLANFWRATREAAAEVAHYADWPVNEADLHARHRWLNQQTEFRARMKTDPDYYDAKIAGWWVWGLCAWIGSGWCSGVESSQIPHLGDAGRGVHQRGIADLPAYFAALQERLRRVRVACGQWDRVLGESVTVKHGMTAVLLDPPYDGFEKLYAEQGSVAADVRVWALANGDNPKLRIALCGYDGDHAMPDSWECVAWKANGGYAGQADAINGNEHRERIWFSPACIRLEAVHQHRMVMA